MKIFERTLTIAQQELSMAQIWPKFECKHSTNFISWSGVLIPDKTQYKIRVDYKLDHRPKVWIIEPVLLESRPHIYPDGSLCLYYPSDPPKQKWTPSKPIARTILLWTSEWLYCYELWLITKKWAGIEAPHSSKKISD